MAFFFEKFKGSNWNKSVACLASFCLCCAVKALRIGIHRYVSDNAPVSSSLSFIFNDVSDNLFHTQSLNEVVAVDCMKYLYSLVDLLVR